MKIVAGILCAGLCCLQATASGLSDIIVPSEDELYEAWLAGEITYEQYQLFLEAVQGGLDWRTVETDDLLTDILQTDEDSGEVTQELQPRRSPQARQAIASVQYRYFHQLELDPQTRYQAQIRVWPMDRWLFSAKVRRELSGRERLVGRTILYRATTGPVRRLELGNFTTKFGLGSTIGSRGKLMGGACKLNSESLLFPDCAGFNGASFELDLGGWRFAGLGSMIRCESHSMQTIGGTLTRAWRHWSPCVSFVANRLRARTNTQSVTDIKLASTLQYRDKRTDAAIEYCQQFGEQNAAGTLLADLTVRQKSYNVHVKAWHYADRYLQLASGGPGATLSRKACLENLNFSFTDRRSGQTGFQVKGDAGLAAQTRFSSGLLAAWLNRDTMLVQSRSSFTHSLSSQWQVGGDYAATWNQRGAKDSLTHRLKASLQFDGEVIRWKTTIGRTFSASGEDRYSWLTDIRADLSESTRLQVWSNLARVFGNRIDYWYLFVRLEQKLTESLSMATKVTERYLATSSNKHLMAFSLEVSGSI